MKVGLNLNLPKSNKINFEGYKTVKSDYGDKEFEFNYVFNNEKKDCYLEVFLVDKDENGNYFITGDQDENGNYLPLRNLDTLQDSIKLESGKSTKIDMTASFGIAAGQDFAYHYVLRPKDNPDGIPEYKIDPGNIINDIGENNYHQIYNVVSDKVASVSKGGAMKLIVPDCNNVLWIYDKDNQIVQNPDIEKARKTNKNLGNKIGGSLAGIEKDLDDGKLDNFTRIITTPIFADDSLTSHGYWNKNCYQMAHSLGNINNYASLQRKLFAKGINLVSDGAYVNEGLEGVHLRHVLQWGKKSPYYNWFRISGLEDSPLNMGVFGKDMSHVTHRVINSKYRFEQKPDGTIKISANKSYEPSKPTYIQIYDNRLVNAENLTDSELIRAYDKLLENNLDINGHNDTVVPYSFRIDPETYKHNADLLNRHNKNSSKKINLYSGEGTRAVSKFEFFSLGGKSESGFETWDANPDIAKLNFVPSHYETQILKNIKDPEKRAEMKRYLLEGNMATQDYAVSSAKYWTKKTNNILQLYIAQNLRDIDNQNASEINQTINTLIEAGFLPEDLDTNEKIVKNVLRGRYNLLGTDTEDNYKKAILQGLMNTPLDSIEVGDDIVSVLASPYMSKRAITPEQIGVSRYDMYKAGNKHVKPEFSKAYQKTDRLYEKEIFNLASEILKNVNEKLPEENKLTDQNGNTTEFGSYVIPLLTAEIARFAIIKGVNPEFKPKYNEESGEISYDYAKTKSSSLISMGIIADSPEDEALSLISKIKHNLGKINSQDKEDLAKALSKSIEGTSYKSFALADMIIGRSQAGLDWRIDATKDIADIDSIRNGKTNFEYTWNKVIEFWSKFANGVREYHPNAYFAAEVTDEGDIYNKGRGGDFSSRYSNTTEINRKLINETGFTTVANYNHLSSNINQIFGKLFDYDGENSPDKGLEQARVIYDQLAGGGDFLGYGPLESIIYSYTCLGNHDKCRTIEGYATDMDMVYTDLCDENNYDYRKRAYKILNAVPYGKEPSDEEINNYDFNEVSGLNIAKCESIASGMGKAIGHLGVSDERNVYIYGTMLDALRNISNGSHKGKFFEAEGFGTKDYDTALDIVLDEMEYIEQDKTLCLSDIERKQLKDKAFEFIIDPAISKYLGHLKFITSLPGNPTLYAGDDYASTGYEATTKNIYVQNRNIIREDWADPKSPNYKEFVKRAKDYIDYQFNLRKRPELQPLNDGTPYMLDIHQAHYKKPTYHNNFYEDISGYEEGQTDLSVLLRQRPNGAMTISLFNTQGLTHKFDEYYRPAEIYLDAIGLGSGRDDKFKVIDGLKDGTIFYDAAEIDNEYKTVYKVENNIIKREDGQPIRFKDSVMTLYHTPTNAPSFTGRRVLYNPQYNIVSNPYKIKNQAQTGSKLELVAR